MKLNIYNDRKYLFLFKSLITYVTLDATRHLMRLHYHIESSSANFIFSPIDRSDVYRNSISANFYTFIEKTAIQRYSFLTRSMGNLSVSSSTEIALRREMRYGLNRSIIQSDKWSDRRKSYFRWHGSRGQHGMEDGESPAAINLFGVFNECGVR